MKTLSKRIRRDQRSTLTGRGLGDARCLFQQPYILNKEKNSREKGFIKMGLGIF